MTDDDVPVEHEEVAGKPATEMPPVSRRRPLILVALTGILVLILVIAGINYATSRPTDSDGDGLSDQLELSGWGTAGGIVYKTDPHMADSDGDGLSDGEEAGEIVVEPSGVEVHAGVSDPTKIDSDEDGLDDAAEVRGWRVESGAIYVTNPMLADTDGDGLSDGGEAGELISDQAKTKMYAGIADPTKTDSDRDGLDDAAEFLGWRVESGAVYRTDPMVADTDGDGLTDGYEAGAVRSVGADFTTVYEGVSDPTRVDSDEDGLEDAAEVRGWRVKSGAVYVTNPMLADTDGDGLSDGEEAGEALPGDDAVFETMSIQDESKVYSGVSDPTRVDSDEDGLEDAAEVRGWRVEPGAVYVTNPMLADTDGDGLGDGLEAGELVSSEAKATVYKGVTDPTKIDSDDDGLDDAAELDLSLDPFSNDSDRDGINDYREVEILGTAADLADTDGDGFDDAYEVENHESLGLDPLWPDEKMDTADYAWDFAQGAVLGELSPGDSIAWLLGNLASGGASFVPGVGWILGGAADLRDAIGLAIQSDWVGASFSVVGLVPTAGDVAAVPTKTAKFVARHPELAAVVGASVVKTKWIPEDIKRTTIKRVAKEYDYLRHVGTSDEALLRLQKGKVDLDRLSEAMKRPGHMPGKPARFLDSGKAGEESLGRELGASKLGVDTQVSYSTGDCMDVCNKHIRRLDAFVDGVAHESKVGRADLTESTRRQIESDAYLVTTGQIEGAHWHFFASSVTDKIGASKPLLDLLDQRGIRYTIHLPS